MTAPGRSLTPGSLSTASHSHTHRRSCGRGFGLRFTVGAHADCAFPSRRGAREVWGNRPPACGVPWKMAQLGKCARATPRQAAGHYGKWPNWANALEQPPPLGCGALWETAQLGKRARATPRQPAGRLAPSSRNGDDHVCDRPHPSCASTRPLKSCGFVQTTATRVQTLTQEVPFSIAR